MRITKYNLMLEGEDKNAVLVKDWSKNYLEDDRLDSPRKIVKMLDALFNLGNMAEEYVYVVAYTGSRCSGVFEVSHGTAWYSSCNPKEIFQRLLLCNATHFVIAHNHPSGSVTPSKDDLDSESQLNEAGKIMGINMLDFLIVGKENGRLKYHSSKEGENIVL